MGGAPEKEATDRGHRGLGPRTWFGKFKVLLQGQWGAMGGTMRSGGGRAWASFQKDPCAEWIRGAFLGARTRVRGSAVTWEGGWWLSLAWDGEEDSGGSMSWACVDLGAGE